MRHAGAYCLCDTIKSDAREPFTEFINNKKLQRLGIPIYKPHMSNSASQIHLE
jgi:hypothetical protein